MSRRHLGEKTGAYGLVWFNGSPIAFIERRPLKYSQSHYRKVLKEKAARVSRSE